MLASFLREDEISYLSGFAFISGFSAISAIILRYAAVLDQNVAPSLLALMFSSLASNTLAILLGIGVGYFLSLASTFLFVLLVLVIRIVFDTLCVIAAGQSETQRIGTGAAIGAAVINFGWAVAAIIAASLLF